MGDWYKTHSASPDCYPEDEYRNWAQDAGATVDVAGNVIWPGYTTDQSAWPAHLRDDAPSQRCNRCGRNTWAVEQFGQEYRMPQSCGHLCDGRFEP